MQLDAYTVPMMPGAFTWSAPAHLDARGSFSETWRSSWWEGFVPIQANRGASAAGVLRGLHLHTKQTDLWELESGCAIAVLADVRNWPAVEARSFRLGPRDGLLIPPGLLHGYRAVEPSVLRYMVDQYHDPADELSVHWRSVGADLWGFDPDGPEMVSLSRRDADATTLDELASCRDFDQLIAALRARL